MWLAQRTFRLCVLLIMAIDLGWLVTSSGSTYSNWFSKEKEKEEWTVMRKEERGCELAGKVIMRCSVLSMPPGAISYGITGWASSARPPAASQLSSSGGCCLLLVHFSGWRRSKASYWSLLKTQVFYSLARSEIAAEKKTKELWYVTCVFMQALDQDNHA